MKKELLIIFAKNPTLGKVKTRIAATMGDEKALAIYHILLSHTVSITSGLNCDKAVYYSDFVDTEDKWDNKLYQKHIQTGSDLGDRMSNAFQEGFEKGYQRICIIGSDCMEINEKIIKDAFNSLSVHDAVIGPAHDGGYYLLGLTRMSQELFENKPWSTNLVLSETINDFNKQKLAYHSLPVLSDVDEEADWDPYLHISP